MKRFAWLLLLGACAPTTLPGASCRTDDDCKALKGGYCAKVEICTRACETEACPGGTVCVTEGTRRVCLTPCTSNANCLPGFVCNETADGTVCEYATPLGPPPST